MDYQIVVFVIAGIMVGWIFSYLKSLFHIRKYKKEIANLQEHLNRQMKITSEGNRTLEKELEKLKKENENLRVSVKTLGQKPGRAEIRLLNIYDGALRKVMARVPGFSNAWEAALAEAEREYEENEKGIKAIVRKVLGPSLSHSVSKTVDMEENK
jgi:Fe-S cluster assembly iron-binding protein IscA